MSIPLPDCTSENQSQHQSHQSLPQILLYGLVGIGNTVLHGTVFAFLVTRNIEQSISNFSAFLVAVTFSFFLNAHLTFKKKPTLPKFLMMSCMMAVLSYAGGWLGEKFEFHYLATFVLWSLFSFIAGFIFSKFVVFNQ